MDNILNNFNISNYCKNNQKSALFFFTDRKRFDNILHIITNLPKNTTIIFREYDLSYQERLVLVNKIINITKKRKLNILIGKNVRLAKESGANGVHFSDNDASWFKYLNYKKNNPRSILSCSCHDEKSLKKARKLSIDIQFISPIFQTTSHPNCKIIGIKKLSQIYLQNKQADIVALGGINHKNIKQLKLTKIKSIAGISTYL